jgi:Spy/CpxP family protein refolding chaperone
MTSAAASGQPAGWGRGLIKVALVLSLVLNLWFIGVLVWHVSHPPRGPLVEIAEELHLADDQLRATRQFGRSVREHWRDMREQNEPLLRQIWEEAAKAKPDQAKIDVLTDQVAANSRAGQQAQAKALVTFLAKLPPEQRATFAERMQRHRGAGNQRGRGGPWQMLLP